VAQAIGEAQSATEGRAVSIDDVDADLYVKRAGENLKKEQRLPLEGPRKNCAGRSASRTTVPEGGVGAAAVWNGSAAAGLNQSGAPLAR